MSSYRVPSRNVIPYRSSVKAIKMEKRNILDRECYVDTWETYVTCQDCLESTLETTPFWSLDSLSEIDICIDCCRKRYRAQRCAVCLTSRDDLDEAFTCKVCKPLRADENAENRPIDIALDSSTSVTFKEYKVARKCVKCYDDAPLQLVFFDFISNSVDYKDTRDEICINCYFINYYNNRIRHPVCLRQNGLVKYGYPPNPLQ